jgi:N-ethylmaleimide reductase
MTLAEFREVFKGPLMGNCGYTKESAEAAIQNGHADLISFGRPYLSNPDLVERFANGWPLAPEADIKLWYAFDAHGYTDFPRYESS